jgi:hypothetical protein
MPSLLNLGPSLNRFVALCVTQTAWSLSERAHLSEWGPGSVGLSGRRRGTGSVAGAQYEWSPFPLLFTRLRAGKCRIGVQDCRRQCPTAHQLPRDPRQQGPSPRADSSRTSSSRIGLDPPSRWFWHSWEPRDPWCGSRAARGAARDAKPQNSVSHPKGSRRRGRLIRGASSRSHSAEPMRRLVAAKRPTRVRARCH